MQKRKVGLFGAGTIGRAVLAELQKHETVEVVFVVNRDPAKVADLGLAPGIATADPEEALSRGADLVIETSVAQVVADYAPRVLETADFCAFSGTALSDPALEAQILEVTARSGRRFYLPHGAVLGLDGLSDAGPILKSVTITTRKSGKSLGLAPETEGVVFEGPAREACRKFPRNVNVHAAVAMAGVGMDRTLSRILAVPGQGVNEHRIEVEGEGLSWVIEASSPSLGGVTGAYTPRSAAGSIARILGGGGLQIV